MYLSERLEKIVDAIGREGPLELLLDVGCDHGYASIAAVERGHAVRALCCDINEGPLRSASLNIAEAGLSSRIDTRLSDGLRNVDEEILRDSEEKGPCLLLIAGMGGQLIKDILIGAGSRLSHIDRMILSPQSEPELVRSFLIHEAGYDITSETWVRDAGKYYVIISAERMKKQAPGLACHGGDYPDRDIHERGDDERMELLFGKKGLMARDPILYEYLLMTGEKTDLAIERASKGSSERSDKRLRELKELRGDIDKALKAYEEEQNVRDKT